MCNTFFLQLVKQVFQRRQLCKCATVNVGVRLTPRLQHSVIRAAPNLICTSESSTLAVMNLLPLEVHILSSINRLFNDFSVVSRKILKDHYQGELEDDEVSDHQTSFDNEDLMSENSFESEDYAEPVSSATAIPPRHVAAQDDASNYDQANNYRTSERPFGDQQAKRGGFIGNFLYILESIDPLFSTEHGFVLNYLTST